MIKTGHSILFHAFKHHLLFCLEWITRHKNQWNQQIAMTLKSLGQSQLDMYTGQVSVNEITDEVSLFLKGENLLFRSCYIKWIEDNKGYREITLSDNSTWTLRYLDKEQYVHIHPSRYSKHTTRVKANILKTVMCTLLFEKDWQAIDYSVINHYRTEKLMLSPIDIEKVHTEMQKVIELFNLNNVSGRIV